VKILVLGLDCAAPEILFGDERLVNIRRLMSLGAWGRLESVIPPITVPAWMCYATSQDPGSLGVYGFRNRSDHSYAGLGFATSKSIQELAIWDQLAREGKRSVILGVPPNFPPRKVNGVSVGCFLTPSITDQYTEPASVANDLRSLVGEYETDVKGFRTNDKAWLRDAIFRMSRKFWTVVKHYVAKNDWDYLQCVDIGLDRVHHGFWKYHDAEHVLHEPDSPFKDVIRDYYLHLDHEIGQVLELVDDDTIILVMSDHGARRLDGGFCINEWLVREKLLVLDEYPKAVTPFEKLKVNWAQTSAWSEGGYYARIFINVRGREADGRIGGAAEYHAFRDQLKAKLEQVIPGTLVFKPEEIYKSVRNVAPDLIVHFGGLAYRSIGGVGYASADPLIRRSAEEFVILENDTGPDDCNHAQFGAFILASKNLPLQGEIAGAGLLDLAPTLLELTGTDVPSSMQGRSLVRAAVRGELTLDQEQIIRERLSGLGYLG
jgi:predicted AlkP superfamily phosphohydrolase/phosphomutase